jgi:peroxiredoxin
MELVAAFMWNRWQVSHGISGSFGVEYALMSKIDVAVGIENTNKAWVEKMGVTYPFLSDKGRVMAKAYGVLDEGPKLLEDPNTIRRYMRPKRSWFIIDKAGIIRFTKTTAPTVVIPNDELLQVLRELQ